MKGIRTLTFLSSLFFPLPFAKSGPGLSPLLLLNHRLVVEDSVFDPITQSFQWEYPGGHGYTADPSERFPIAQTPSPLNFNNPSPDTSTDILVSTAFYPGAFELQADLVFCSLDSVLFYVHSHVLSAASEHAFRPILAPPLSDHQSSTSVTYVPESSTVLNIIIHALYSISSAQYSPPFTAIAAAVDRMPYYEIDPKRCIVPSNPLRAQLLSSAPANPLELYALAARHDVFDVAAQASSHLISYPLGTITDEIAMQIGAVYLKRLLCLHVNRLDALKNIILVPPFLHLPTSACKPDAQQSLTKAWATAASLLAVNARPDLSVAYMRSVFAPLQNQLACSLCRQNFLNRVEDVVSQWSAVKCTI